MSYPEFRKEILNILQEVVPENISLQIIKVQKTNNLIRYGISFRKGEANVSPTIYLEPFYQAFQKGADIEGLARELYDCYTEETTSVPEDVYKLEQFDSAKPQIFVKMLHMDENRTYLQDTPYITFLDFAIVAYFEVESGQNYKGSVLIKKHHTAHWNISEKELLDWAVANTRQQKGTWLRKMADVLSGTGGKEEKQIMECAGEGMYVLTNKDKYYGAATVYYPEVLKTAGDWIGEDYYLLPASIHEWVLIAKSYVYDEEKLFHMVRDINDYEVSKEEILSYNVYYYSTNSQKINVFQSMKQKNN